MADEEYQHRFGQSWQFHEKYTKLSCQTGALQSIAQAFTRNMNRVRGIGALPVKLVAAATINEAARMEALVNTGVPFSDPRIVKGDSSFDQKLFEQVDDERQRLIRDWIKNDPNFNKRAARIGLLGMNIIIDAGKDENWQGVQATMAGMLMGLWTAFESALQDTWVLTVNAHPKPLADRIMKTLDKEDQQKFLPGKMLSDAGYDLRNCMGDILLRKRAVDFQQLKTIRAAYNVAFAGEFEPIFDIYNTDLSRLEAVRNLFAHKGGVVDAKFLSRIGDEPGFKDSKAGDLVWINGRYVASRGETVADCSAKVIEGVDKWLINNQPKEESP